MDGLLMGGTGYGRTTYGRYWLWRKRLVFAAQLAHVRCMAEEHAMLQGQVADARTQLAQLNVQLSALAEEEGRALVSLLLVRCFMLCSCRHWLRRRRAHR